MERNIDKRLKNIEDKIKRIEKILKLEEEEEEEEGPQPEWTKKYVKGKSPLDIIKL